MGVGKRLDHQPAFRRTVAIAIALMVIAWIALPAWAAQLTIDPSVASPGDRVAIHGNQFDPESDVTITFDGVPVADTSTNSGGVFEETFEVPAEADAGEHTVVAFTETVDASATLTVPPATTTTSTTAPTTTTTTSTTVPTSTAPTTTTTPTTPPTTPPAPEPPPPTTATTSPPSPVTTTVPSTSTTAAGGDSTTSTTGPPDDSTPTTVASAITLPFVGQQWPFGVPPTRENAPASVAVLEVGLFSLTPGAGPAGSLVTLSLALDEELPGTEAVQPTIDGEPLGDPVQVSGRSLSAQRTIPDVEPGSYDIGVSQDGKTLAVTTFHVTEPIRATQAATGGNAAWVAIPVLLLVALGWRRFKETPTFRRGR